VTYKTCDLLGSGYYLTDSNNFLSLFFGERGAFLEVMANLKLLTVFSKLLISDFLGRNRPKRLEKQKSEIYFHIYMNNTHRKLEIRSAGVDGCGYTFNFIATLSPLRFEQCLAQPRFI